MSDGGGETILTTNSKGGEGVQHLPETLVDVLSDLQQYSLVEQDKRAQINPHFFTARRSRVFLHVGFRTGMTEMLGLPILAPLAFALWYKIIFFTGHPPTVFFERSFGFLLALWLPILINVLMWKQIKIGNGNMWNLSIRRFLAGRSISLILCGVAFFFLFRNLYYNWPYERVANLVGYTAGTVNSFAKGASYFWYYVHPHFIKTSFFCVVSAWIAAGIPWIFITLKAQKLAVVNAELNDILENADED